MTPLLHSLAAARGGRGFGKKSAETAVAVLVKISQEHFHV